MLFLIAETYTYSGHFDGAAAMAIILLIGIILCSILTILLLPALIVAAIARRRAEHIRNERVNTVIAQYEPPRGLSPAEVGLLYDMRCSHTEVMATLFDLEQRRIIHIADQHTVDITDQAAYETLAEYEKIAIRLARGETASLDTPRIIPMTVTDTNTGETRQINITLPPAKSLRTFSLAVQQSLAQKGIPTRSFALAFIKRVGIITLCLALLPLLTAGISGSDNGVSYAAWSLTAIAGAFTTVFLFGFLFMPVYIGCALLLTWIWTKIAGRYWMNTRAARAVWPELEGYKWYLKRVDLDNIQFESTDQSGTSVTKTLPYAMVFELDTRWQARIPSNTSAP